MFYGAAAAIVLTAAFFCRRHALRVAAERRDLLRDCAGLFDEEPAHGVDRAGFGFLSGRVRGLRVQIGLLAESLAFRRLPQLWLRIEVRAEIGGTACIDIVRRPANVAVEAPSADFSSTFSVPHGWPADTLIRGTPGADALMRRLPDHGTRLLSEPRLKEILLTPRGLRVSSQASEGVRGTYLLLRGSHFGTGRIAQYRVKTILNDIVGLAQSLRQQGNHDVDNDTKRHVHHAASA